MGLFGFGKKKPTYSCCGISFATKDELDAHTKAVHGGQK